MIGTVCAKKFTPGQFYFQLTEPYSEAKRKKEADSLRSGIIKHILDMRAQSNPLSYSPYQTAAQGFHV